MDSQETPPTRIASGAPLPTAGYLEPGSELGGYRIVEVLGTGGMGQVFRAIDAEGIEVAMKVLHPHLSRDAESRQRLNREVSALHRVRHGRVARVLDAEVDALESFIVTELLDGLTLDQSVREEGVFADDELIALAEELAEALRAIHAVDVVHRDLKPSNVMLTEEGAKVIDFGIAQVGDESRITQTGLVVGTAGYLAPEVFSGSPPTTESIDWYAWAAVLVYAATGRQPFGTGPFQAVLARMERGEPELEGLPVGVAAALRAGLHPDPAVRSDPEAVIRQLQSPHRVLEEITRVERAASAAVATPQPVALPYQPTQIPPGQKIQEISADSIADSHVTYFSPLPPVAHHPPAPPAAGGVLLSFVFLAAMLGVGASIFALICIGVVLGFSRTVGIARIGQFRLRMRRGGAAKGVSGGLALRLPWYVIRGFGAMVLPLLLASFIFALILGLAWVSLAFAAQGGVEHFEVLRRAVLGSAGGIGALSSTVVMWKWDETPLRGKSGLPLDYDGATRVGLRVVIATVAGSRAARTVLALGAILLGLLVLFLASSSSEWFDIFRFIQIEIPGT